MQNTKTYITIFNYLVGVLPNLSKDKCSMLASQLTARLAIMEPINEVKADATLACCLF
jgi:hypothetical protein